MVIKLLLVHETVGNCDVLDDTMRTLWNLWSIISGYEWSVLYVAEWSDRYLRSRLSWPSLTVLELRRLIGKFGLIDLVRRVHHFI